MDALVLNHQSRDALLALALKYESTTGKHLKWRRDTDAAIEMVLDSLSSGVEELFQVAVIFMETLPVASRREFLRLQQLDVPDGYEARVQLYRGVAHRLLKPIEPVSQAGSASSTLVRHTYRGVTWEETVASDSGNQKTTTSRRVYRGQEY